MRVTLDHLSVPTRDKEATARFFARVFALTYEGPRRDYAPLRFHEGLTLNFEQADDFHPGHFAFRVTEEEFAAAKKRLEEAGVAYGSSPAQLDGQIYERGGLRGFYFDDPNGHGLEVITPA